MYILWLLFRKCYNISCHLYIDIADKYVSLFFKTISKAQVTAGHIAGLLVGLKANIHVIITFYKRKGIDAKGNLGKQLSIKYYFVYNLTFYLYKNSYFYSHINTELPSAVSTDLLQYILTISRLNGKLGSEFGKAIMAAEKMQQQHTTHPNSAAATLVIGIFEDIGKYLTNILVTIERRVNTIADNAIIRPKNNSQSYLSNYYDFYFVP